jgi:peptidoglycan hydrolase-like protein with peptidoglycan-binding domain
MVALPEDEAFESDAALAWAVERFRIDPNDRRQRQPAVEDLQKWLNSRGLRVYADGIFGPSTLEALQRAYDAERLQETVEVEAKAAATDFGTRDIGAKTAQQTAQRVGPDTPDAAPPSTSAIEEASARPVALSDSAISDVDQDRLGFRPYVEAVAEFILAEQTRPPLAIAINARWGQGKTSFMNMLDAQLKRLAPQTTTRVATTWFNPWKYSEPEQVWAAFVANVTRCLSSNLTRQQSWGFRRDRFREKLRRHGDLSFWLRVIVAAVFLTVIASLAFMDWARVRAALLDEQTLLKAFYDAATSDAAGYLWYIPAVLCVPLAILLAYVTLANKLGLNLLDYVEKTDFKDKIGTLSQFEHEMRRLADAVPDDLKVVVFIDDLDRCKGKVLGEIIEALQLADVSRACIFVMGMDLRLVAEAIERDRAELAQSAGSGHQMEHGSGYKFLEKIIQARLSLPAHDAAQMDALVASAMGHAEAPAAAPSGETSGSQVASGGATGSAEPGLADRLRKGIGLASRGERRTPSDSESVIEKARHYGSLHFDNPRQLKRFINGFRLQTYLAAAARSQATPIDRLARFLVLAEKWPAVIDYMLLNSLGSLDVKDKKEEESGNSTSSMSGEIDRLKGNEKKKLFELLDGPDREDPMTAAEWKDLADWCGFTYYHSLKNKAP